MVEIIFFEKMAKICGKIFYILKNSICVSTNNTSNGGHESIMIGAIHLQKFATCGVSRC